MKTLGELLAEREAQDAHRPALLWHDEVISYGELGVRVNRLAHHLLAFGLQPGDRIAMMLRREPALVVTFLAAARCAAVVYPLNPHLPEQLLSETLLQFPARFLVIDEAWFKVKSAALTQLFPRSSIILSTNDPLASAEFSSITRQGPAEAPAVRSAPEDICYLNFTSGSTGAPKAVRTSHAHLYWNTRASVETFDIDGRDIHLPLFAAHAHPHEVFCRALYNGGSVVLVDSLNPRVLEQAMKRSRATCVMATATTYQLLLPVLEGNGKCDSARLLESGGMVTPPQLIDAFEAATGTPITPVWGSTETTGIALAAPLHSRAPTGSVGRLCPYYRAKVLADDGREAAAGTPGTLWLAGDGVARTYENRETAPAVAGEGFHCTGDSFKRDADGYFYFLGRTDGQIKIAGLKVFPEEVRAACLAHPGVGEAVVVAVADRLRGQVHAAVIAPRANQTLDPRQFRQFLRRTLPNYKVPKHLIMADEIPHAPGGKVDVPQVQRLVSEHIGEPTE